MLVRVNGLDTFYSVQGEGTPVLLLHGWGVSSQSLAGVQEALAATHRAVAMDLPGFGWSQRPAAVWGHAEYAHHALGVLDALGIAQATVLATLSAAGRHPDGGRARPRACPGWSWWPVRGSARPVRALLQSGWEWSRGCGPLRPPGLGAPRPRLIARLTERVGSRDYRAAGAMRPILVKGGERGPRADAAGIQAPTLILWGDRDQEVPRQPWTAWPGASRRPGWWCSRCRAFPVPGCTGGVHEALRTFLAEGGAVNAGKAMPQGVASWILRSWRPTSWWSSGTTWTVSTSCSSSGTSRTGTTAGSA